MELASALRNKLNVGGSAVLKFAALRGGAEIIGKILLLVN
jgi:hypothetical protein